MTRTRVSTTVDSERLERARQLIDERDSELLDRALAELIEQEERRREIAALAVAPYDSDAELNIDAPVVDWDVELPYDGEVPAEVVELARRRRRERS